MPGCAPEERRARLRQVEQLGDGIARLSAHITAATARLLAMIRAFDASEGWHEAGFRSCARWLSWRTGVGPAAAREGDPPHIDGGPAVAAETVRRLACDAGLVWMAHGPDGSPLDVGRKSRSVPPALRRALDHRDGGCRFPGCGSRFCDAHHVVPWAEGGETKLDNLILLCRHHHRRVHEDGWTVEVDAEGETPGGGPGVRFRRPDGWPMRRVPGRPVPPPDPAAALERAHGGAGIDEWTPTTRWEGDPMDVDLALGWLRRHEPPLEPR